MRCSMLKRVVLVVLLLAGILGVSREMSRDMPLNYDAAGVLAPLHQQPQEIRIYSRYVNAVDNGYFLHRYGVWHRVENGQDMGIVGGTFNPAWVNLPSGR